MAQRLHLLCAGAAKGLVLALRSEFERASGVELIGTFGAVGALREQFDRGVPCDAIVLTRTMLDGMAGAGDIDAASLCEIGWVHTGVAVPLAAPAAAVHDAPALRALLGRASAIYLPDPERATAGIHALKVLRELDQARPARLRPRANGAAAMAALAAAGDDAAVGITQVSEILYTPGLRLVGTLPPPHALATLYGAAVARTATQRELAANLLSVLCAPQHMGLRQRCGFEADRHE
jgi:molybdate transport system substrate-binding protein